MDQPLKRQQVIGLFGDKAGKKLFSWLDDCCIGFCSSVNNCLGISADGDPDTVLNRRGQWITVGGGGSGWLLTGNAGTDPTVNFIGTTDTVNLVFKRGGVFSGYITDRSVSLGLRSSDTGNNITSIGNNSLQLNTGHDNTAIGKSALSGNTTGIDNTAIGSVAGVALVDGSANTLIGWGADVATSSTSNAIALGSGAIAADNEFAISTQVNSVNFSGAGIVSKILTPAYGTIVTTDPSVTHILLSSSSGATTVNISGIKIGQSVTISDFLRIAATSNITIDSGAGHIISSRTAAAQTLVLASNGISATILRIGTASFMLISNTTI